MVGQQTNFVQPEVGNDLRAHSRLVLQLSLSIRARLVVCPAKVRQNADAVRISLITEAWTGLMEIDQDAASFLCDALQRPSNSLLAVTVGGGEDVSVGAVSVHPHEHWLGGADVAPDRYVESRDCIKSAAVIKGFAPAAPCPG